MKIRRMSEPFVGRAEGTCCGLPYQTELAGSAGISVVFWCGAAFDEELLQHASKKMCNRRDVVYIQASLGEPTGYYSHPEHF